MHALYDISEVSVHTALQTPEQVPDPPRLLKTGSILDRRWRVDRYLALGAFGQIYVATDLAHPNHRQVAVKAEAANVPMPLLQIELQVLNDLSVRYERNCPHAVELYGSGVCRWASYLVMELCSTNLRELSRMQPSQQFTPATCLRLAAQMLRALEHLHSVGWLHRDVKPSNFCLGRPPLKRRTIYLIDFGLARKYVDVQGRLRRPRPMSGFHGTARYASLTTHQQAEMSRKDDLWSLFYILVEQLLGELPWRQLSDKHAIKQVKNATNFTKLLQGFPSVPSLLWLQNHLQRLGFYDAPDYADLITHFRRDLESLGAQPDHALDWEI